MRHYAHKVVKQYGIREILMRLPYTDSFTPRYQELDGKMVNVSSRRMQTFKQHGTTCYLCGLEATHFLLVPEDRQYFKLVLMNGDMEFTQDHVYPTSLGGNNHIQNARTLCEHCNRCKSNLLEVDYIFEKLRKDTSRKPQEGHRYVRKRVWISFTRDE